MRVMGFVLNIRGNFLQGTMRSGFTQAPVWKQSGAGFTLIEALVVIALFGILILGVLVNFRTSRDRLAVETTAEEIISSLETARARTIVSQGEEFWGVHFESEDFTLFQGPQYTSHPDLYERRSVAQGATIVSIVIAGGGSDVVFDRITGTSATTGFVILEANNPTISRTVYIEAVGRASVTAAPPPQARLSDDTRHVHFTIPWSLTTSTEMILLWTDPPLPAVEVRIPIALYLNNNQFLWESDTDVNGSIQHLRIVTHSIDANQTVLAVRRDRDENDKTLQIFVDLAGVGQYDAAGLVTPGPGITAQVQ